VLLAIPMFIIAGNLMNFAGISIRLVRFSMALSAACRWAGHGQHRITHVLLRVTGQPLRILLPWALFSFPPCASKGTATAFVRPSHPWPPAWTIIPPAFFLWSMGSCQCVHCQPVSCGRCPGRRHLPCDDDHRVRPGKKHNYPSGDRFSFSVLLRETKSASLALLLPVIIVGGMGWAS